MDLATRLPPPDPTTIHTQITILSEGSEYAAYVITDDKAFRIPIRLKPDDVASYNKLLQEAIQEVVDCFSNGIYYISALDKLAKKGNFVFKTIFAAPYQHIIRTVLCEGAIVQIVSKDFFVPWEFLYDGPLDQRADIRYYWGMSYIISRFIIQDKREGAFKPHTIEVKRPKVGLITCDQLPFVEEQELPALKAFHTKRRIHLLSLRSLSITQHNAELTEFGRFLRQEIHVLHFACHAYEQNPIEKSYLFVKQNFPISIIDFVTSSCALDYSPFVILNACLTGVINPLHTSSWAEKLWGAGARGVLATDFRVPDKFAAEFSKAFYDYILSGMNVGEALLNVRRDFWNEQRNPLALAYGLYSSPSIKIISRKRG
jgi:CHAT domain